MHAMNLLHFFTGRQITEKIRSIYCNKTMIQKIQRYVILWRSYAPQRQKSKINKTQSKNHCYFLQTSVQTTSSPSQPALQRSKSLSELHRRPFRKASLSNARKLFRSGITCDLNQVELRSQVSILHIANQLSQDMAYLKK